MHFLFLYMSMICIAYFTRLRHTQSMQQVGALCVYIACQCAIDLLEDPIKQCSGMGCSRCIVGSRPLVLLTYDSEDSTMHGSLAERYSK
jgi:hypothetical protein